MKTFKLVLAVLLLTAFYSNAYGGELADYQASATALTNTMQRFQKLAAPSSEFDVVLHRDPMRSLVDSSGGVISRSGFEDGLVLQGVIYSGDMKSVLIDDKFYKVGETVGPYTILEIRPNGFLGTTEGREQFIPLYAENDASR
jgi:hypothetical protein